MALSPLLLAVMPRSIAALGAFPTRPLPLRGTAATTRGPAMQGNNGRQTRQNQQAQGAPAAWVRRSWRRRDRGHAAHARQDPRGLRALRLRAAGDAGDRIHRRAGEILARPGPAERGRVLVSGRRRAVVELAL